MTGDTTFDVEATLNQIIDNARIPRATYRIQFNADFTFDAAQALVDYLHTLGISDLYASPLFKPRSGSTHGYDTVNYTEFNPALGGEDAFNSLIDALQAQDMSLLLDIVPNHMGVNTENDWWMDVLKHGPASVYAGYFDIDWRPRNRALDDKVLLPVLGDHYGRVLESGELKVVYWHGDFYIHYYEHQFPLSPETYRRILGGVEALLTEIPHEDWAEQELLSILTAIRHLPDYHTTDSDDLITRRREQHVIRERILNLFENSESFRTALTAALEKLNGEPGAPESFDDLDALLSAQPYRLAYWRVAADEINYRRFFDINDLAALRIEDDQVFADTHQLALRLLAEGKVSGLRVDHPDGLYNPPDYFFKLQIEYTQARLAHLLGPQADDLNPMLIHDRLNTLAQPEDEPKQWPLYVLVEKILSEMEPLPFSWAVYGTTGYDFLNAANNVFVKSDNEDAFETIYRAFTGEHETFQELTDRTKKLVMDEALTSEIESRSAQLARLVEHNRRYRGFTRNSLAFGLGQIIAALPIYRTYITGPGDVSERDRHYIEQAVDVAKRQNPLTPGEIFDFLQETLLLQNITEFAEDQRAEVREFVMNFQQITGPVMAKSVEDTAFYNYNRLVSLNEVGGHPEFFGGTVADFHAHNQDKVFPHTMLGSSTHDTKRSEDVRARINVLSEIPSAWHAAIEEWAAIGLPYKTEIDGTPAPSRNDEYLIYQTLVGAYPDALPDDEAYATFKTRVIRYMHKAINEAKQHSNWLNPNQAYAQAITDFIGGLLDDPAFRQSFEPFQARVSTWGKFNSLGQVALKLTAPGVPDIYQGNELWDYSLVDPDNRRPVDYDRRRTLLDEIQAREDDRAALSTHLLETLTTGAAKLYLTYRTLTYRRDNPAVFIDGSYEPLSVDGPRSEHVVAYLRRTDEALLVVIVPCLLAGLTDDTPQAPTGEAIWNGTVLHFPKAIQGQTVTNLYTGQTHTIDAQMRLADLLATFPVAVLGGAIQ